MEKDGQIHKARQHNNQPYMWMLPKTIFPRNFYTREHELDLADVFVAFYPHVTHWDTEWGTLEREQLDIKRYRVNYDARMVLGGKVYLVEVDRGSEDHEKLLDKVNKYVTFADSLPGEAFQVIFTMQKYPGLHFGNRVDKLLKVMASKKRRNMFLVARHTEVLADPLGACFVSPLDPLTKRPLSDLA